MCECTIDPVVFFYKDRYPNRHPWYIPEDPVVHVAFSLVEAFAVTSGKLWWAEFHAESMNPHKLVELSGLPVDGIP